MPEREYDGVKPPNEGEFKRDRRDNGYLPLTGASSPVATANLSRFRHGDPGGSADLTRLASPVAPPNERLREGDPGYTVLAPAAVEPGKGAVPVSPFLASGGLVPPARIRDEATDVYRRG
jgi:hypothetical protein